MIPESRRGNWVSEDFVESESETDELIRRDLHKRWQRRGEQKLYEHQEFSRFKKKGLTHLQAHVAAYQRSVHSLVTWGCTDVYRMPAPKRKAPSSNGGFPKKTKSGGTTKSGKVKKYADKYGGKTIDWDTVKKLADAAAKKEINKNIETQTSQAMCVMTHDPTHVKVTGFDLGGLNFDNSAQRFNGAQAMIFNLGYLSQHGSSLSPGYRIGQRLNAKYFKITITANLPQVSADCTYHWRIIRRKNDQSGQLSYAEPAITSLETIGLFKPLTDGPLASQSYYGRNATATNPFPCFASASRQNTEAWTFCKGGHGYKYVKAAAIDTDSNDDRYVASFSESMYFPLEEEWEFVSRTGSDIKGGNYFFVMWREGGPDFVQYSAAPNVTSELGNIEIKCLFELSFKDG